jgi:hypothetical protein
MSLRIEALKLFGREGEVDVFQFTDATLIVGPPNSSKTTILRMIDFCLGVEDSAASHLGPNVANAYLGIELEMSLGAEGHSVRRSFDRSFGPVTRLQVDDSTQSVDDFRDWIMEALGWPLLQIPRGRVAQSATERVPLSFRTLLRHIYRREDSWYEFASREEEFHRRAVLAFYLGLAESRYSGEGFALGEKRRDAQQAEADFRAIDALADRTVRRVTEELGLDSVGSSQLLAAQAQVQSDRSEAETARQEILEAMRANEGFSSATAAEHEAVQGELQALSDAVNGLAQTADGYRRAVESAKAEQDRLQRAEAAVGLFTGLPVTQCPVCAQAPPITPASGAAIGECYLCRQAVGPDTRRQRIKLEIAVLEREAAELGEVIARTDAELAALRSQVEELLLRRRSLEVRMDEERRDFVSPFLSEVEVLNRTIGGLDQRSAALTGLEDLLAQRASAAARLDVALRAVDEAEEAWNRRSVDRRTANRRCQLFTDRMNDFLGARQFRWDFPRVWIDSDDLSFHIGASDWDTAIGGESRVLFFLAYHYALLYLPNDLTGEAYPPGLAILDNPLQQGVRDSDVAIALDLLIDAARTNGGQTVMTAAHQLPLRSEVTLLQLTQTYSADEA